MQGKKPLKQRRYGSHPTHTRTTLFWTTKTAPFAEEPKRSNNNEPARLTIPNASSKPLPHTFILRNHSSFTGPPSTPTQKTKIKYRDRQLRLSSSPAIQHAESR